MLPSFRPNGPTYRITVPSSASTALAIEPKTNVENNYVALINTGTASVVVSLGTTAASTATHSRLQPGLADDKTTAATPPVQTSAAFAPAATTRYSSHAVQEH